MWVYTKQAHDTSLARVQGLVEMLRKVVAANDYVANESNWLVGELPNGVSVQLRHTSPIEAMGFFTLRWGKDRQTAEWFTVQFDLKTGAVHDSSKFDENGTYLDVGHIQAWHDHHEDEDVFIGEAHAVLSAVKKWQRIDRMDGRIFDQPRIL